MHDRVTLQERHAARRAFQDVAAILGKAERSLDAGELLVDRHASNATFVLAPKNALQLTADALGSGSARFWVPRDTPGAEKENHIMYQNQVTLIGFLGKDAEVQSVTNTDEEPQSGGAMAPESNSRKRGIQR